MSIGEKIKQARISKNMSQEELAAVVGVSRQAISKWESDKAVPSGANREALNQCLEIKVLDEDVSVELFDKKKKILMIMGWGLAIIFAISTAVLAVKLYNVKNRGITYLPTENVSTEYVGNQEVTGTDSNSETVYIYYDDDFATEEDVVTYEYVPDTND